MSTILKNEYLTPEEYLEFERNSEYRSEYYDGEIVSMTGASRKHNLIVTNLVREIGNKLKNKNCEIYANDMKVKVSRLKTYVYPDITIVCGEAKFDDKRKDVLLNPLFIIEVLSKSTEPNDRGRKFLRYQKVSSLVEYILISQKESRIERYLKKDDKNWLYTDFQGKNIKIEFKSINCKLNSTDIYHKIKFDNEE
jgi:Uma2 family endonuclease